MTLIIGLKCSDGIVVGADGATTLGDGIQNTIRQESSKIASHDGLCVFAGSDSVGLAQRYEAITLQVLNRERQIISTMQAPLVGQMIRQSLAATFEFEVKVAITANHIFGPASRGPTVCSFLLTLETAEGLSLIEFDQQGSPTVATDDLCFFCIGLGRNTADPFMAFLRRTLWRGKRIPDCDMGIMTVYWTLLHAIDTAPGGIGLPVEIAVVRQIENGLHIHKIANDELQGRKEFIHSAERALAAHFETSASTLEPPTLTSKVAAD